MTEAIAIRLDEAATAYDAASEALFRASLEEFGARKKLLDAMRREGIWTVQIGNRRYHRALKGAVEVVQLTVLSGPERAEGAAL